MSYEKALSSLIDDMHKRMAQGKADKPMDMQDMREDKKEEEKPEVSVEVEVEDSSSKDEAIAKLKEWFKGREPVKSEKATMMSFGSSPAPKGKPAAKKGK